MMYQKDINHVFFNQLMEQERSDYINASDYERSEERVSYRNGYYERDFTTRVGTLELRVPPYARRQILAVCF